MYESGVHGRGQDKVFFDTQLVLEAPRMDEITKGDTKAWAVGPPMFI